MKEKKEKEKISLESPAVFLNPVPVVMVSSKGKSPGFDSDNIITIAWTGTVNSDPPMISVAIRKSRHSHRQISESEEFAVNLVSDNLIKACDYCGVKSGKDHNKFDELSLSKEKSEFTDFACGIKESPVSMYCKVKQVLELGSHDLFLGEIINVKVDESLYDRNGKIDFEKAKLAVYSHGEYYTLNDSRGFFGFSVAREKILKKRMGNTD